MNYEKAKQKYHNSPIINQRWTEEEYFNLLASLGEYIRGREKSINDVPVEEMTEVALKDELKNAIEVLGKSKVAEIIDRETDLDVVIPFNKNDFNYGK